LRLTHRGRVVLWTTVVAALLVLVGGPVLYARSIGLLGADDPTAQTVEVVIPKGSGISAIGRLLEERGIIKSGFGLRVAAFLRGESAPVIEAGHYELPRGLSAQQALDALSQGATQDFVMVTFPEGSWLKDFARILGDRTRISAKAFLKLTTSDAIRSRYEPASVHTVEGLVFPSTYQIVESDTARSVAERLVGEFERQASELDFSEIRSRGLTDYDALIVASMVEAEAGIPRDRPKIAAVIYNRLRADMRLEIDATVEYALGEHKTSLGTSDLNVDSPYNTRRVTGLPPTPIGAPGLASLNAALHPAHGDWLYYVLKNCEGAHVFSTSYEQFLQNKARYQQLQC
jgi:UPF0755 protein